MKKVFVVVGTRPEAIKMAPVYRALVDHPKCDPILISTGQHKEMLAQVFDWFGLTPDADLKVMKPDQTLASVLQASLAGLGDLIEEHKPDAILAQGDTTTVLAAGLAAFTCGIDFGHVEAGLRTYNLESPYPEEGFRQMVGRVARWHFAPTDKSVDALKAERVSGEIIKTGNTVIDALLFTAEQNAPISVELKRENMILVTGHRRENQGQGFEDAFGAIADIAAALPNTDIVYPVHLNPNVQSVANRILANVDNVFLIPPVAYPEMVSLMKQAKLIMTDSGGVQEEAPSFRVPVLVMRDTTERMEAVEAGAARLIGTGRKDLFNAAIELMTDDTAYAALQADENPFGDGTSASQIADILARS